MSNLDLLTWYIMLPMFVCGFTVTMYVIVIVKIRYSMETKEDKQKVVSLLKKIAFLDITKAIHSMVSNTNLK